MSESDTPRTDAVISGLQASAPWWDKSLVENARQLERELTAANARADDLQTRLAVLTAGVEAQRVVIEAANDRADLWRKRCKEAQRCMGLLSTEPLEWCERQEYAAARDAGKDE